MTKWKIGAIVLVFYSKIIIHFDRVEKGAVETRLEVVQR